jgi:hypothetical protein
MLEQPHFEDELTTLTARPVVPLEEIDAKLKHRRHWFVGGAFALAMLLGAASALISAYFKLRNIPDPEIQSLSVSQPVVETPVPTVEIVPERPKPKPKNTDHTDRPVVQSRRIRDSVLIDEWQERRARRVERRERREQRERRRAGRSGRDLSNLDEIFEGPRRPRS